MDGMTVADAKGVVAPINFIEPMAEKPYSYNYEPPPGVPARNTREETHTVKIIDARPINDTLSLEREGFVLLRHPTAATDLYDEAQISNVYYPECERLIKEYTGAARVHVFDHIVRNAARMAKGSQIKGYAGRVHNDYTAWSAPQRVRDLMGERGRGTAPAPLRRDQCLAADRRAAAALAAGAVRRADVVRGESGRLRPALSGPHRRDLCRDL